jgi:hypothetical protein
MRYALVTLALVESLATLPLAAQSGIAEGRWSLGTTIRATVDIGAHNPETWGVDLTPEMSYFISPRLAVGGSFRVAHYAYGIGSKQLASVGPGVTFFPLKRAHAVSPFLGAQLRYTGYSEAVEGIAEARVTDWEWHTRGGLLLRLGSSVGLEVGAKYERSRFRMDQSSQLDALPDARLGALLGLQVFF